MRAGIWVVSGLIAALLVGAAPAQAHASPECTTTVEKPKKKVKLGGLFRTFRTIANAEVGGRAARPLGVVATAASNANIDSVTVGGGKRCADADAPRQPGSEPAAPETEAPPARAAKKIRHPSEIPAPANLAELNKAMDAFGRYHCMECEGGSGYDSWVNANLSDQLKGVALPDKIATLRVGDALRWKGEVALGSLTVTGAAPVEGFECRQVRILLQKGAQSAERPGLYCKGNSRWVEVY